MKQKIIAVIATITTAFVINTVHAQTATNDNNIVVKKKVLAKFQKDFPYATNITWTSTKNNYDARFSYNGIETVVDYNKSGVPNYVYETYGADKLPSDIKKLVSNAWQEYDIVNATQVQSGGKTAYLVNIKSKKFSKVIRINDDGMDVYENIELASN